MNESLYRIGETLEQLCETLTLAQLEGDSEAELAIQEQIGLYLGDRLPQKIEQYAAMTRKMRAWAVEARTEAARCTALAREYEAREQQLLDNAKAVMQRLGIKTLEAPAATFLLRNNGGKDPLPEIDECALPERYWREFVMTKPNMEDILLDLRAGHTIAGVTPRERGQHIVLK